ncbi:UDP-N-acetyl glucosamine 2-epimerase [Zhongshania aliphaticivorans]|uniref:UDP-N-acetyl glucosamine 2-epimerase n=1 Tax=Zhongshania aliphaticivorans TaxID=1470434 RepID=UPI0012E4DC29|nr:UDP-N-acetylglucosamine 2-epimerase [Zhongshania aliphaticivorans]CAA0096402.1 UDP-N-acetylglucosamine 2-epimerase [Zhongshania aliphaticivorans]
MIHIVLGTKAQLIKMAPIMVELNRQNIPYRFISTGQHRDTMEELLSNFGLKNPDHVLYSGDDITSIPKMAIWALKIIFKVVTKKRDIFDTRKPGIVLVHGDTFSTLLGAIMGKIARLKVGHVESGLRSFNWFHPFPEEITRVAVFKLSDYYFCPGETPVKNLTHNRGKKINTGCNTLFDSLRLAEKNINISDVNVPEIEYAVISIHRFENIHSKNSLIKIIECIELISEHIPKILFILHKPTEKNLKKFGLYEKIIAIKNIELRQRYDYFKFIKLLKHSEFVVSDGGSNQEECAYLGKPTLLLRKATEREEGIGKNCVICEYKYSKIRNFCKTYKAITTTPTHTSLQPSKLIVSNITDFR